jgi:hypothetical protein
MFKSALIGMAMLALSASANLAQDKFDCASAYKSALERLSHEQISPKRFAILSRRSLRIYDACESFGLGNAKSLFESLDRSKN